MLPIHCGHCSLEFAVPGVLTEGRVYCPRCGEVIQKTAVTNEPARTCLDDLPAQLHRLAAPPCVTPPDAGNQVFLGSAIGSPVGLLLGIGLFIADEFLRLLPSTTYFFNVSLLSAIASLGPMFGAVFMTIRTGRSHLYGGLAGGAAGGLVSGTVISLAMAALYGGSLTSLVHFFVRTGVLGYVACSAGGFLGALIGKLVLTAFHRQEDGRD